MRLSTYPVLICSGDLHNARTDWEVLRNSLCNAGRFKLWCIGVPRNADGDIGIRSPSGERCVIGCDAKLENKIKSLMVDTYDQSSLLTVLGLTILRVKQITRKYVKTQWSKSKWSKRSKSVSRNTSLFFLSACKSPNYTCNSECLVQSNLS